MSAEPVILHIEFHVDDPDERPSEAYARELAERRGMRWKLWIRGPEPGLRGGIYVWDDRASAETWVADLRKLVASRSSRADVTARFYHVDAELSAITRGPLER